MADYTVYVDNENEIGVADTSVHAALEEIKELLKLILERLPLPQSEQRK